MKLLTTDDRVVFEKEHNGEKYKLVVSPLPYSKKLEAGKLTKIGKDGRPETDYGQLIYFYVSNSVKEFTGATNFKGQPLSVSFKQDGTLDDKSVDFVIEAIGQIEMSYVDIISASNGKLPVTDLENNKTIDGAYVTLGE